MRKGLIVALATVALVACAVVPPGVAARADFASCGDVDYGNGIYDVKALNIACSTAKHVAKHEFKTGEMHFHGWSCDERQSGESFSPICVRHLHGVKQTVKFYYGV